MRGGLTQGGNPHTGKRLRVRRKTRLRTSVVNNEFFHPLTPCLRDVPPLHPQFAVVENYTGRIRCKLRGFRIRRVNLGQDLTPSPGPLNVMLPSSCTRTDLPSGLNRMRHGLGLSGGSSFTGLSPILPVAASLIRSSTTLRCHASKAPPATGCLPLHPDWSESIIFKDDR